MVSTTTTNKMTRTRQELATARWAILRDALLHNKRSITTTTTHEQYSIHRFHGYNLLKSRTISSSKDCVIKKIESKFLKTFEWNSQQSLTENLNKLVVAVLALTACYPKGNYIKVIISDTFSSNGNISSYSSAWLELLQKYCQTSVYLRKIDEEETLQSDQSSSDDASTITTTTTTTTTLFVQESSNSTKYKVCLYDLHNDIKKDDVVASSTPMISLWTREPYETKISLETLISHRKNHGVDNTGNICVWDSERTLAYLLYYHLEDFRDILGFMENHNDGLISKNGTNHSVHILELGTGMAGLAAICLGLRLALEQQRNSQNEIKFNHRDEKKIRVTLTDGNEEGVKNNKINQYLTQLYSQSDPTNPYQHLDVSCQKLLWTTDIMSQHNQESNTEQDIIDTADIILISDCTHFQNFHAALAITTLRCLKVGGTAIFCQPTRGQSLNNFYNLLLTTTTTTTTASNDNNNNNNNDPLVSCTWKTHRIIEQQHEQAILNCKNKYDESLHRPKLLLVTKLREMTQQDCHVFIQQQESRLDVTKKLDTGDDKC